MDLSRACDRLICRAGKRSGTLGQALLEGECEPDLRTPTLSAFFASLKYLPVSGSKLACQKSQAFLRVENPRAP